MGQYNTYEKIKNLINHLGINIDNDVSILDFGCGGGDFVNYFLNEKVNAYGCDLAFKKSENTDTLIKLNKIKLMDIETKKIPFKNEKFDIVISNQVFEHVDNYDQAFMEISRVLKNGGISLNLFPSRYRLIEAHVNAPFASIIKNRYWLYLCSLFGFYRKVPIKTLWAVACENEIYLKTRTNYLPKKIIRKISEKHFKSVEFCEHEIINHLEILRNYRLLKKVLLFMPAIYSTFGSRVLLLHK
jgi:ubiquinone/menaquinone biosynthesis C-methylase UbiE